jgi:hypothetical protein
MAIDTGTKIRVDLIGQAIKWKAVYDLKLGGQNHVVKLN